MRRLGPESRRTEILNAAVEAAKTSGFDVFTREEVAAAAKVSVGLVNRYYGSMAGLRQHVMARAIKLPVLSILAQGLAAKYPLAISAPVELRAEAAKTII